VLRILIKAIEKIMGTNKIKSSSATKRPVPEAIHPMKII
jgi:hypothetical protein